MQGPLYLAWRYLLAHRFKTAVLVLSITLIVYVPVGLRALVAQSAEALTARAEETPLLVGAKGSRLELVLSSLYFESKTPETLPYAEVAHIAESGLADPIPVHARFHSRGRPIVGTTLEYLELRRLRVAEGGAFALLGDCLVGARVAEEAGLATGDAVVSSPENVFDLAGVYPLKMHVTGVLEPTGTPDDRVIFVDVKTAWVIEGLGHGHQNLADPAAASGVLAREGDRITANASVVQYNEITPENQDSFHFHGDLGEFPITAVVALPRDDKASALLQGRYQSSDTRQIVRPAKVMDELIATIFTVQGYVVAAVAFVGTSTVLTTILVFLLSLRLRRGEMRTLGAIGAARARVAALLSLEVVSVVAASLLVAGGLTLVTARYGEAWIRALILT